MAKEALGECLIVGEAELDIAAVVGDLGGAEEVVPAAETDGEVETMGTACGQVLDVVPDVELGIVEDVF